MRATALRNGQLAVAVRAGDADDLAGAQLDVDRSEPEALETGRRQRSLALFGVPRSGNSRSTRVPAISSTSFCGVVRRGVVGALEPAVPQDRDAVSDPHDLGEPVRHEQDGAASRGDAAHELEHDVDTWRVEGRGRLVEDEHLRFGGDRADDLDELTVAGRQGRGVERQVDVEAVSLSSFSAQLFILRKPGRCSALVPR